MIGSVCVCALPNLIQRLKTLALTTNKPKPALDTGSLTIWAIYPAGILHTQLVWAAHVS